MKSELQIYLKENARHGSREFPAGFYATEVPKHFKNMLVHWHEEMEFAKVRHGFLYYDIDQTRYDLKEGDILLISPDTLHSAHQKEELEAGTASIVFHLRLAGLETEDACTMRYLQPICSGDMRILPVISPENPHYDAVNACFEKMWACQDAGLPYRELQFKTQIFVLLQLIWQMSDSCVTELPKKTRRLYEAKIKRAMAYIQEHYTEPITVAQLAQLCGFSQIHFMNIFKAAIGSTCIEYLVEYRLARAALELQETDHSITQIAMGVGFQNTSYFNRAFKKQYGMTPTEYRKKAQ